MAEDYKKQAILDSLYNHCQTRTYTSKDVLSKLLNDVRVVPPTNSEEKLLDIIREYKNTGKNLEATIDMIYSILYPPSNGGKINSWNPHET